MTRLPDNLAQIVVDPRAYADWNVLHPALAEIRRNYPFARAELPGYRRFWVASKFDDIRAVARDNDTFLSGIGAMLSDEELDFERRAGIGKLFRSVVAMNEPDHREYRMLTQAWFQPANVRTLEHRVRARAAHWVGRMAESGSMDFAREIAIHYPLLVIMDVLGVPEQDEPMMLRLTQEYFGSSDQELNRRRSQLTPEQKYEAVREVIEEARAFFAEITAERRRQPRDDLATVIANGVVDGEPISDLDAMGYYITIAFAGHDTTSSSLAGALWALAERPEELAKVQREPALVANLVEEAVRWTTPIHQFTRAARRDAEVAGAIVRKGDFVILSFPSGNRDETVFDSPFEFRVDRAKAAHVGFGYGAHMCLGMHLARLELKAFFEALIPRLSLLELAGEPRRTISSFVGGPKSLPLRCRFN